MSCGAGAWYTVIFGLKEPSALQVIMFNVESEVQIVVQKLTQISHHLDARCAFCVSA